MLVFCWFKLGVVWLCRLFCCLWLRSFCLAVLLGLGWYGIGFGVGFYYFVFITFGCKCLFTWRFLCCLYCFGCLRCVGYVILRLVWRWITVFGVMMLSLVLWCWWILSLFWFGVFGFFCDVLVDLSWLCEWRLMTLI